MAPLVLYHFPPSAPSRSALLVIRNLDLEVDVQFLDLFQKEQLKPEFVKINPQHCVPTLKDNEFVMWESRAIAAYLVDSKSPGNSLYPTDIEHRALVDQRLYFDAGTLYARIRAICYPIIFLGETKISDEKRKNLNEAFEFLNGFLAGKDYVAGNTVTIADLSILSSISTVSHSGSKVLDEYKNIGAWYERCKSLPGFDENDAGAIKFGSVIKKKLDDSF